MPILPVFENSFQGSIRCSIYSYSPIKKNDVKSAYKIWISVGINDMNYDVDRSKNIYSCFQADKYMYKR